MNNSGECSAVIMAAGMGSRMTDITSQCPKPLLPMGRFPMIWYPIRMCEQAGFTEIIIITRQSWKDQIQNILLGCCCPPHARLEVLGIPDHEEWGTADSLRHVADKLKTTVLVMSCDTISDCDLGELMSVHRKHKSSFTVMLSQLPKTIIADLPVPGVKQKQKNLTEHDKISIGFENSNKDHIVYWKSQVDMDAEFVSFSRKYLDRYPNIVIQSSWSDCHVYLINKGIISYLKDKREINSLREELLPIVVKRQLSTYQKDRPTEDSELSSPGNDLRMAKKQDLIDYVVGFDTDLARTMNDLSLSSSSFGMGEDVPQKDVIRCYAFRQTSGFCLRANTVLSYFETTKQIPRLLTKFLPSSKTAALPIVPSSVEIKSKSQVGTDCLLGEKVTIGEKVSVKKSVIGKQCKIDGKVKITNSVIMDNVTIQESSNISNCIIGGNASISDKCELNNCIVGQNQTIPTMSKHANEVISNVSQMMEISLA